MYQNEERSGRVRKQADVPRRPGTPSAAPEALELLQSTVGNAEVVRMLGEKPLAVQRGKVKDPAGGWRAHPTAGRADGGVVLSGHGTHDQTAGAGQFAVPAGTTVHFYVPHGDLLDDAVGGQVERGDQVPPVQTYLPGQPMPDYTLYHPVNLDIHGSPIQLRRRRGPYDLRGEYVVGRRDQGPAIINELRDLRLVAPGHSVTVEQRVRLSQLLRAGMGDVHFAACREVI